MDGSGGDLKYFLPVILTIIVASHPPPYTIWLYGDSISHGYGLGEFDHPSPINSIWGIANLLTIENGHPEIVVKWAEHQDVQGLWVARHEGVVKPGDVIVFENAGPHFGPEPYRAWLQLWQMSAGDNRLYFATTPDSRPVGDASDYSAVNEIVKQEATYLLDWESEFAAKSGVVDLLQPDGIHFNAFGNFLAAVSILRAQGVTVRRYDSVVSEFQAHYPGVDVLAVLAELVK